MVVMNQQAEDLNRIIKANNPVVYELLSARGKAIYFPRKGILAQGAAAKGKEINATIGTAYEDDGKPMVLHSIARGFALDSKDAFPYAPSEGIKPLRDKWQELIKTKNGSCGFMLICLHPQLYLSNSYKAYPFLLPLKASCPSVLDVGERNCNVCPIPP